MYAVVSFAHLVLVIHTAPITESYPEDTSTTHITPYVKYTKPKLVNQQAVLPAYMDWGLRSDSPDKVRTSSITYISL